MNDNSLKDILSSHFNAVAKKCQVSSDLKSFGSEVNNKYLRSPYSYIESNFLNNLSEKRVLDYCCGTGIYSIIPALNGADVFGIDISQKSIDVAVKRATELNLSEKCSFKTMDAENLEFKKDYFDLILIYGSLSYLNLNKSFKELSRVLKPDGKLIIIDSLGNNPLIKINRRRNIKRYAPNHFSEIMTPTFMDLDISLTYFDDLSIKYFDFFSLIGFFLSKNLKINLNPKLLIKLDSYFLKIPFINRMAFKFVCNLSFKKN